MLVFSTRILSSIVFAALLSACASSAKINAFRSFAETASAYQNTIIASTDVAIQSNIETNSFILIDARELRAPIENSDLQDLRADIMLHNDRVLDVTRSYAAMKKQLRLLSDYFSALGVLATYDGSSGIASAAKSAVESLQALSPTLKNAKIGNASLTSFTEAVTPIVVAEFQSRALTESLRENAQVIDAQLQLQAAFLSLVGEQLKADQELKTKRLMNEQVIDPYAGKPTLPANWSDRRLELVKSIAAAESAADESVLISKMLRQNFLALVEGRLAIEDLALIGSDLQRLSGLTALIAGKSGDGK